MIKLLFTLFSITFVGMSFVHAEDLEPPKKEVRVWTNKSGKELKATLVEIEGDKVTILLKRKRKKATLAIDSLSDEDQEYLKEWKESMEEYTEKNKEQAMIIEGQKIVSGKLMLFEMETNDKVIPKLDKKYHENFIAGMMVPDGFDPINKNYTIMVVSVPGHGDATRGISSYTEFLKDNCILIATKSEYSSAAQLFTIVLSKKWPNLVANKWPLAFCGFSGGAKNSCFTAGVYSMYLPENPLLGIYMSGCNADKTNLGLQNLKPKLKRKYKKMAIYLSSGSTDTVATPQHHKQVAASLKKGGFKKVMIHTFQGAHKINSDDQSEAIKWMREVNPTDE